MEVGYYGAQLPKTVTLLVVHPPPHVRETLRDARIINELPKNFPSEKNQAGGSVAGVPPS